jgi:simple sugar transport system substrate-binding protein
MSLGSGVPSRKQNWRTKPQVVGTSLPSIAKKYLATGAVDLISFWDPADAGYVANKIALMVLQGHKITNGMNLGVKGYEKIKLVDRNRVYGQAWTDVTKDNFSRYDF